VDAVRAFATDISGKYLEFCLAALSVYGESRQGHAVHGNEQAEPAFLGAHLWVMV